MTYMTFWTAPFGEEENAPPRHDLDCSVDTAIYAQIIPPGFPCKLSRHRYLVGGGKH